MLILSRREGESLILETADGPVEIVLLEYKGGQTRVGVEAPTSVKVLRRELVDATLCE